MILERKCLKKNCTGYLCTYDAILVVCSECDFVSSDLRLLESKNSDNTNSANDELSCKIE